MSNNAVNVRVVFRDSTGKPRANGYVYFYENKTTTLASIYSDELLTIAQNNPYQLNAYGEIEGDVKYSGKCTVTATNYDGSDPLSDDDVESQGGSSSDVYVDQFKVVENSPAAMTVVIKAGKVMNGETLVTVAAQTTTAITAPISNPRIDRIVIDKLNGVYSIVTGSEAASPVAPAIPTGKAPAAQISLATSTTTITDSLITDERISGSVEPSNINTTETLSNKTIGDTNTINAQDDAFTIDDAADATLQIDFNVAGTTGTKTTITSSQTANRVITIPDATDTLTGKATTDTFTNKTIGDGNTINAQDDAFTIDEAVDATKQVDFDLSGATTGTKTTITASQTANRTVTLPDANDTLVGKATTDTLTNKSVSLTSNTITGTTAEFNDALSDNNFATQAGSETLTNKTISLTSNTVSGTTAEFNTALTDNDFATLAGSESLTNKTIGDTNTINAQDDAFTINDAADATVQIDFNAAGTTGTKTTISSSQTTNKTITLPDATDTLVGKATTDTLTNKTIDLDNNTIVDVMIDKVTTAITAVGYNALVSNTTGASNTAIGNTSLATNLIGAGNTAIGASSLASNITGSSNTASGNLALQANTNGDNNVAVGASALTGNSTGDDNTSVGAQSLLSNVSGTNNTAVGSGALYSNTASGNTAVGFQSLYSNTTGVSNTAVGISSLFSSTGASNCTAVGYNALYSNTINGNSNTAVGVNSLATNTTGIENAALGRNSLTANTIGNENTAVGAFSLSSNTTAQGNTAIGWSSLSSNTTGTQNTAVGASTGSTITIGTNLTCLGYNAEPTSASATNEVTLGDANVTTLRCATTTITAISDVRDKKNIGPIPIGLDFINALNPVKFDWNMRNANKVDIPEGGFIAQELLKVSEDFNAKWLGLVNEGNPDRLEAAQGKLLPVMVKAIQELSARVKELEKNA